jgi:O-antigen ligase
MSPSIKRLLSSLTITFLFLYLFSPLGATFLGVVSADTYIPSFVVMSVSLMLWLWVRIRGQWVWHRTSFDLIFLLWGVAFSVSVVANLETLRRSLIGLWYMLMYVGVWYALHDMLSNRGISRKLLVDALLNAGIFVILFSFVELFIQGTFTALVSIIGNPNALGAILLGMTPFAVGRALTSNNRIANIGWGLYSLIIIINLMLTLSRGAWLGMFTALGFLILLLLKHYEMLSLSALKLGWEQRTVLQRRLFRMFGVLIFVGLSIAGLLLINSFSIGARRPELRTRLWNSALLQFSEKPITGQGFYTFGRDYGLSISIPPAQSHAHAHSVPLNIMAEMGLIGFAVFVITLGWVVRLVWRRWSEIEGEERLTWIMAIATLAGFGVHHLFDLPAMMPIVALVGLLVLILVCAPYQPQPMTAIWRRIGHLVGITILWIGLLTSGVWSGNVYQHYLDAMRISFAQADGRSEAEVIADYRETAMRLNDVIAQDPKHPIYHQQQAFVWGLVAESGDADAIQHGIEAYQQFLELEPNHAISWANLSALQWQAGDSESAIVSIERAIDLALNYQLFRVNLQLYRGELERDTVDVPTYKYNQDFGIFEFLREPLNTTFLPQVGWGTNSNN